MEGLGVYLIIGFFVAVAALALDSLDRINGKPGPFLETPAVLVILVIWPIVLLAWMLATLLYPMADVINQLSTRRISH